MLPTVIFISDYWNYYTLLEDKFLDTLNYVELSMANFNTYSNEYIRQMYAIGAEIDTIMKFLCGFNQTDYKTMKDYAKYIKRMYPEILTTKLITKKGFNYIEMYPYRLEESPLNENANLFWWKAYDNIKHGRVSHKSEGSLKNTLYLLAGLYILEDFCIEKKLLPTELNLTMKSKIFNIYKTEEEYWQALHNGLNLK